MAATSAAASAAPASATQQTHLIDEVIRKLQASNPGITLSSFPGQFEGAMKAGLHTTITRCIEGGKVSAIMQVNFKKKEVRYLTLEEGAAKGSILVRIRTATRFLNHEEMPEFRQPFTVNDVQATSYKSLASIVAGTNSDYTLTEVSGAAAATGSFTFDDVATKLFDLSIGLLATRGAYPSLSLAVLDHFRASFIACPSSVGVKEFGLKVNEKKTNRAHCICLKRSLNNNALEVTEQWENELTLPFPKYPVEDPRHFSSISLDAPLETSPTFQRLSQICTGTHPHYRLAHTMTSKIRDVLKSLCPQATVASCTVSSSKLIAGGFDHSLVICSEDNVIVMKVRDVAIQEIRYLCFKWNNQARNVTVEVRDGSTFLVEEQWVGRHFSSFFLDNTPSSSTYYYLAQISQGRHLLYHLEHTDETSKASQKTKEKVSFGDVTKKLIALSPNAKHVVINGPFESTPVSPNYSTLRGTDTNRMFLKVGSSNLEVYRIELFELGSTMHFDVKGRDAQNFPLSDPRHLGHFPIDAYEKSLTYRNLVTIFRGTNTHYSLLYSINGAISFRGVVTHLFDSCKFPISESRDAVVHWTGNLVEPLTLKVRHKVSQCVYRLELTDQDDCVGVALLDEQGEIKFPLLSAKEMKFKPIPKSGYMLSRSQTFKNLRSIFLGNHADLEIYSEESPPDLPKAGPIDGAALPAAASDPATASAAKADLKAKAGPIDGAALPAAASDPATAAAVKADLKAKAGPIDGAAMPAAASDQATASAEADLKAKAATETPLISKVYVKDTFLPEDDDAFKFPPIAGGTWNMDPGEENRREGPERQATAAKTGLGGSKVKEVLLSQVFATLVRNVPAIKINILPKLVLSTIEFIRSGTAETLTSAPYAQENPGYIIKVLEGNELRYIRLFAEGKNARVEFYNAKAEKLAWPEGASDFALTKTAMEKSATYNLLFAIFEGRSDRWKLSKS